MAMSVATVMGVSSGDDSFKDTNFVFRSHYFFRGAHVTFRKDRIHREPMTDLRPNSAPYDMHCPIARTLDIVGERWTILILRDLVTGGPRRFQDFERSLSGISPNTLSARLKRLEE